MNRIILIFRDFSLHFLYTDLNYSSFFDNIIYISVSSTLKLWHRGINWFHPLYTASVCSVLNKLTLQKSKIKMKYSKKKYNYYSDDERMSYIREYLSSPESKSEFCKRHGFCAKLLTYWLNKYQIEDKDMGRSSKPVNSDAIDSSISELQKELSLLRAENRKLHRALADESLRHEACEELINLAESTYHIKVRKNSDAK